MSSDQPNPKPAARKRRQNARTAAARAIQKRDGISYRQALVRADAQHQQPTVVDYRPGSFKRCAAALDDAHAALRVHAAASEQLREAADRAAWNAEIMRIWPPSPVGPPAPAFPTDPPSAEYLPELTQAATCLHNAIEALDDCKGAYITAAQTHLTRLKDWCSQPASVG